MMKLLTSMIIAILLTGCATTITKTVMPTPPAQFMVPAQPMTPMTADDGGNITPISALSIIATNNNIALQNANELTQLQKWITETLANINSGGKK